MLEGKIAHVGMSVSDIHASLAFWEKFLGVEARWQRLLDGEYLSAHVGYPNLKIEAAFIDLPGGNLLELLDYQVDEREAIPEASANPGHAHLCLGTDDIQGVWEHAIACGARPIRPAGPVEITTGPNKGAKAAYLRVPPDWQTLELFQSPPAG